MAQIIKEITVDVAKRNLFQAIVAKQHDSNSRFLKVTLTNEGTTISVDTNSVVTINASRADGLASAFVGVVNADGTVTVPLTTWMLELDDLVKCDIAVVDSESRRLTSTSFELEVETAAYSGDEIMDDENADLLLTLVSDYAQLKQRVENLEKNGSSGGNGSSDSTQNVDLTGYATEQYVQEYAQPKGDYLTEHQSLDGYAKTEDIPTKPEDIGAQPAGDYLTEVPSGYVQKSELPTKVSQFENDSGYLTEHQDISGKLDASELPTAINTALAQAKASGEFDGADGQDGKDGYTPVKGKDYFDGEDGQPGADGNGIKSAVLNADYTLTLTFDDGTSYTTPSIRGAAGSAGKDGQNGQNGSDGVGIESIKQTTTSTADGGNNVFTVTLTNGTTATFTVKNGSKGSAGSAGADGTSVTVKSVTESTEDGGSNVVTFSDGTTLTVKNGSKGSASAVNYTGKKILFLGDSIVAPVSSGWVGLFNKIIKPASFVNTAVSGAGWAEFDTTEYDGNPVSSNDANNVIGNQIEKIARGKDSANANYSEVAEYADFDMIIIAAGINDYSITADEPEIEDSFTADGVNVDLSTLDKKVFASAFRYCIETLRNLYPDAQIFVCTPTQTATDYRTYAKVKGKRDHIIALCERMSVTCIDTFMCGIYGLKETSGAAGLYLNDGVHPNAAGRQKIADYNAREVIKHYIHAATAPEVTYTNQVPISTDADGNIYNGCGYKNGCRVRSGGAEESGAYHTTCTGFIPVSAGDVVRISGCTFDVSGNTNAINAINSSFESIGQFTSAGSYYGIFASPYAAYNWSSVVQESDGVWKWVVPPTESDTVYIRVTAYDYETDGPGETLIVTVNEEIA